MGSFQEFTRMVGCLVATLLVSTAFGCAHAESKQKLSWPAGWTPLSKAVCAEDWRSDDVLRYCTAQGDFDGDGVVDTAAIALNEKKTLGIVVWLSSIGNKAVWVAPNRDLPDYVKYGESLGIKILSPGNYLTVCGKHYRECQKDEPESVTINTRSILFFKEGAWGDIVYYDRNAKKLRMINHSD